MERTWGPIIAVVILLAALGLAGHAWLTEPPREPRFMRHVQAGQDAVVRARPIRDEELNSRLRQAYVELGRDQTRLAEWVEENHPALAESFAGVQEAALFNQSTFYLAAGILALWMLCAIEAPRKPGLLLGTVLATAVGGAAAAGMVALDGALHSVLVTQSQMLGAGLLGALWVGGVAAFALPIAQLQLYVTMDALKALVPALVALMLMMVVGFCMQLLDGGLDVVRLPQLLPPTLIYALPMVLPAAFLTAVVISFAKFQNDNELIAVRAAGVSLFQVVRPLLAVSLLLSGLAAFLQFESVPRANLNTSRLGARAIKNVLLDRITRMPDRTVSYPGGFIQYETYSGGQLQGVVAVQMEDDRPQLLVSAASATVGPDPLEQDRINVTMQDILYYGRLTEEGSNPPTVSQAFIYPLAVDTDEVDPTDDKFLTTRGLRTMIQRYNSELEGRKLFENATRVHRKARRKKEDLEKDLATVQARMDAVQADLDAARSALRSAESAALNAQRAAGQLEEKINALETRQEAVAKRMEEMDPLADPELYKEVARDKDQIDDQLEELRASLEERRAEAQEHNEKRQVAEGNVRVLQERLATVQAEVEQVRAHVEVTGERAHLADTQRDMLSLQIRVHRRLAWALSILGFTLMGIPLGVMAGSRSIMMAFGISFLLVLVLFYVPLSVGVQWAGEGAIHPALGIWAGNAVMCMLGLVMTAYVCRR